MGAVIFVIKRQQEIMGVPALLLMALGRSTHVTVRVTQAGRIRRMISGSWELLRKEHRICIR